MWVDCKNLAESQTTLNWDQLEMLQLVGQNRDSFNCFNFRIFCRRRLCPSTGKILDSRLGQNKKDGSVQISDEDAASFLVP
jgi:hypothetical protein